jgi:hypothetical protein
MKSAFKRILALPGFAAIVLAFVFAGPAADMVFAQPDAPTGRFSAGFLAGVFRPTDDLFRQLYGSAQMTWSAEASYRIFKRLYLFSNYGYRSRTGNAEPSDFEEIRDNDPLRLRMNLLKAGAVYGFPIHRMVVLAGGGVDFCTYRERWESANATTEGNNLGFLVRAGAEYPLYKRLSLGGWIDYSHQSNKAESPSENELNLGGLEFSIGLKIRIW